MFLDGKSALLYNGMLHRDRVVGSFNVSYAEEPSPRLLNTSDGFLSTTPLPDAIMGGNWKKSNSKCVLQTRPFFLHEYLMLKKHAFFTRTHNQQE